MATERLPRLMAISARHQLRPPIDLPAWLASLPAAGVEAAQIREKDLSDRDLFELVRRAREILAPPIRLLVNGRADIAIAAGADGVHLPAAGLPAGALRRRFGKELLIGRSTHRVEEVEAARREGADYVFFGPVYPTPGKEKYGPPVGLEALRRAAAVDLPVYALGGITGERFESVAREGAWGAAGIRLFQSGLDILRATVSIAEEAFGQR